MPARRIHTTDRDLAILRSIGRSRYLTATEIEWLYFPGRADARWRDTHATAIAARQPLPEPSETVSHRLNSLAGVGHLTRIPRVGISASAYVSQPAAYMLTRGGQETIEYRRMLDDEQADLGDYATYRPHRTDQDNYGIRRTLDHDLLVGRLYAAILVQLAYTRQGLSIEPTWSCAKIHARYADHVAIGIRDVAVMPDATFDLDGTRYLVEVETGANKAKDVTGKLAMYRSYARSAALHERYTVRDFVVLWVVSSEARRATLAKRIRDDVTKAVVENARQAIVRPESMRDPAELQAECYARHRMITAKDIHPLTIREGWQVPVPDSAAAGFHLAEAPLW